MATVEYDRKTNPIPEPIYSELRKAHAFAQRVIVECNGGECHTDVTARFIQENDSLTIGNKKFQDIKSLVAWRDAVGKKRIEGAMNYYAKIAAQFPNAPDYDEMVRYVIYGSTSVDVPEDFE